MLFPIYVRACAQPYSKDTLPALSAYSRWVRMQGHGNLTDVRPESMNWQVAKPLFSPNSSGKSGRSRICWPGLFYQDWEKQKRFG